MVSIDGTRIKNLVVACDAGMGSSLMLAASLKKLLKKNGVHVTHAPVREIPADADVVVTQNNLAARVRESAPEGLPIIPFQLFMGDPAVARLVDAIQSGSTIEV